MSIKLTLEFANPEQVRDALDLLFGAPGQTASRSQPVPDPGPEVDVSALAKEAAKELPEIAPAAEDYLKEHGYDPNQVLQVEEGTGAKGRFLKKDAMRYVQAQEKGTGGTPGEGTSGPKPPQTGAQRASGPSKDDTAAALKALFDRVEGEADRDTARTECAKLLSQFGAGKVSEVKPDQRAAFIEAAENWKAEGEPESQPAEEEAPPAPEPAAEGEASIEQVRESLAAVSDALGLPACRELLAEFSVGRISDLPEGQYETFIDRAAKKVAAAEDFSA